MAYSPIKLKIGQINAGRGKHAMAEIRQVIENYELDVICIQEPYVRYGKLGSIPTQARQIFSGDSPSAAIVITNPEITVTRISQGMHTNITTVEVLIK